MGWGVTVLFFINQLKIYFLRFYDDKYFIKLNRYPIEILKKYDVTLRIFNKKNNITFLLSCKMTELLLTKIHEFLLFSLILTGKLMDVN